MSLLSRFLTLAAERLGLRRPAAVSEPVPGAEAGLGEAPLDVLAVKLAFSHLRNRQQLMGPPPTTLGHLDQNQAELLIRAAITAAMADGHLDENEERMLRASLSSLELQVGEPGFITAAIRRPLPLDVLLRDVRDPHLASLVYAASLMAIDKHGEINRAYLHYLALRLRLPPPALERLHSQYGYAADT
ncbi:DUF533 domain-containing protein [Lichenibacterium ramalinae]|uniref:DUF533 domain-containing protein n=1 Tax=Lichenibacterium ramalinae TaxID=2316527 RepID=A0A4Q2RHP3_9HYPH|nr:DUF533 domain-containing protein [Lichenibacterium ramalinae]RYB06308.1 DUF533 domain-containing protein [Lichenibacterium ramalinae]